MDEIQSHLFMRTSLIFLLLYLFQPSAGREICTHPQDVTVPENNPVGQFIADITTLPGVTLKLSPAFDNTFRLQGNQLLAAISFDFENLGKKYDVVITCYDNAPISPSELTITIIVVVGNVNDNAPRFDQSTYHVNVSESSPVGTSVGHFAATDLDINTQLFYTLTSDPALFKLRSPTIPDVLTNATLNYERVKNVSLVLYAQDTPLETSETKPSFTASTTIMVTITDQDNRPPWFQPCTKHINGEAVICYMPGYNGSVVLNELQTGFLPLQPGPLYAIDGDSGINEEITYQFLSGNDHFEINANTGNISMLKPVSRPESIHLTVLAAQKKNSDQFATTKVTISVRLKSDHLPEFQKSRYTGLITKVGSMAMDNDKPLYIHATDKDYHEAQNPFIVYNVAGSSDFYISGGFLFMTSDLPDSTLSLNVVATDESNGESATAELIVEVKTGLTTTSVPMSTSTIMTTTPTGESTRSSTITEDIQTSTTDHQTSTTEDIQISTTNHQTSTTKDIQISTTHHQTSTTEDIQISTTNHQTSTTKDIQISTTHHQTSTTTSAGVISTSDSSMATSRATAGIVSTNPSSTSEASVSSASTDRPPSGGLMFLREASLYCPFVEKCCYSNKVIIPSGGYGSGDMAALGVTLGILLFACLVAIGVLVHHMRKEKADWRKIYEVNVFRSSLGQSPGGFKEGLQFTNEAFQNNDEGGMGSSPLEKGGEIAGRKAVDDVPLKQAVSKSLLPLHTLLSDDTSQAGSDKADNEKEVKPILTKERRMEEGYKAVWFKEDIDPNAKEEVVIIPDSRVDDSEDDEDEEERHKSSNKNLKMERDDTDLDSGLGVKMGDRPEDSDDDDALTSDL